MYAVIATGGKQYRVTKDGVLRVEIPKSERLRPKKIPVATECRWRS